MSDQHVWRGLAVTYAVVAIIQLYLTLSTRAMWAGALAGVWLLAAFGCGAVSFRYGQHKQDDDVALDELVRDGLRSAEEALAQRTAHMPRDRSR